MGILVRKPAVVSTYTGTWGALDNGFSADMAFRTCFPPDRWEAATARLDGLTELPPVFIWNGIDYPAQGFGINSVLSMDESVEVARVNGIASIRKYRPGQFHHIVSGYSQGAICSFELAHEFLPGKELADYADDLIFVVNFGDPTCPKGRYPDGWGITRYQWDPRLEPLLVSYDNPYDMYGRAPEDTYLHIGFLVLKQFKLDFMSLVHIMIAMIQNDEFTDAVVELLDPLTPGLVDVVSELTGLGTSAATAKIAAATPTTGGVLGALKANPAAALAKIGGLNMASGLSVTNLLNPAGLIGMGTGFLAGFLPNSGLGVFGKIAGGLLGGGSGPGGTDAGWQKMGKTLAWLLQFGITGAHGRYADPGWSSFNGRTALDDSVDALWRIAPHL